MTHAIGNLLLLKEHAIWSESCATLWLSDLHLGKADSFRRLAQPVPKGTTRDNLARVSHLVARFAAKRIVFLGDLFHGPVSIASKLFELVAQWREAHRDVEITLVHGNHDRGASETLARLNIIGACEPHPCDDVICRHFPLEDAQARALPDTVTVLAGHLHPMVRLAGPAGDSLRLPCYILQGRQIILPAFGAFTGGANVPLRKGARLCVVTPTRLVYVER